MIYKEYELFEQFVLKDSKYHNKISKLMQNCLYKNLLLFLYVNIVKILGDDKVGIYENLVAISWKRAVHEEPFR